ncbi:MAG: PucR family transcriptional regulator [Anaerovoracaceae bacterium]
MRTTVSNCLQLHTFNEARLLAGEEGLNRRIRHAYVLEPVDIAEIKEFVEIEDTALLTGFFAIRDDVKKQCEIVETVAAKGAAALIILFEGRVIRKVSEDVKQAADKWGLPLIVFKNDADVGYSDVLDAIENNIVYGDSFDNKLINNTIFHLLDFDKHPSFQSALKKAALNNGYQVVLFNEDYGKVFAVETRHQVSIEEAIAAAKEKKISSDKSSVYTMVDVNGVLTYWGRVMIGGEKYLMLIADNEDQYTVSEMTKLAEIIELAMGMWKYTPERDLKTELIRAICRGNSGLAKNLAQETGIETSQLLSVFVADNINNRQSEEILEADERALGLKVLKYSDDEETCGVILDMARTGEDRKTAVLKLFDSLKEIEGVRVFQVTGIDDMDCACDAYRLITESRASVQYVFPFKRIFSKYELTLVCNCVNIQMQGGFVKKSYMQLLEVFKTIGGNKGKQLLDTLETFVLDAGMNSSKTSEFMGIHPNTVQYRLKKINELLGAEITGNRVIPGLTIALALKRIEKNS